MQVQILPKHPHNCQNPHIAKPTSAHKKGINKWPSNTKKNYTHTT